MAGKQQYSDEELLDDLRRVAHKLGKSPSAPKYDTHGRANSMTLIRRFGSWNEAKETASLETTPLGASGEKHPDWNEGAKNYYYGKGWSSNREIALERADGICEHPGCEKTKCGSGLGLHVHHIVPHKIGFEQGYFPSKEDGNTLDNLLVVCEEHHKQIEPDLQ